MQGANEGVSRQVGWQRGQFTAMRYETRGRSGQDPFAWVAAGQC
jgi:hypothetical protein